MKSLIDIFNREQYSITKVEKNKLLLPILEELHQHHLNQNHFYKKVSQKVFHLKEEVSNIDEFPFLPVSVFKNFALKSILDENVYKVLSSSGTTGSIPSKIYLDAETAKLQTLALSKIINHILGKERIPMLIVDSKTVLKDRTAFSARGAGILGLSIFGKDHTYVLDENYELDNNILINFLQKYNGKRIFIFGFTFMVWQNLVEKAFENSIDLSNAILIHSGGWKKLIEKSVDNDTFKAILNEKFGITQIFNFYGMVEQVGSVFLENSQGYLHCPNFADVIIRNPVDFSVQPHGQEGLIQVVSALPKSYPGFSLLTEDIGTVIGEDNAENGWKGKYFKILGRAKKAELRGCSDTFAEKYK